MDTTLTPPPTPPAPAGAPPAPFALAAERLVVTVLISDVRGYTGIAERTDPVILAGQLDAHRREMRAAIRSAGGTVLQHAGDACLAVFGAPAPLAHHQALACRAATAMHARQARLDDVWAGHGLEPFGLGIGVSTGEVAAALLGGANHLEYTVVGDTVNLAQRLQVMARRPGTTVVSAATAAALPGTGLAELPPTTVKGRAGVVRAFRLDSHAGPATPATRPATPTHPQAPTRPGSASTVPVPRRPGARTRRPAAFPPGARPAASA